MVPEQRLKKRRINRFGFFNYFWFSLQDSRAHFLRLFLRRRGHNAYVAVSSAKRRAYVPGAILCQSSLWREAWTSIEVPFWFLFWFSYNIHVSSEDWKEKGTKKIPPRRATKPKTNKNTTNFPNSTNHAINKTYNYHCHTRKLLNKAGVVGPSKRTPERLLLTR